MLVVMNPGVTDTEINEVEKQLKGFGFSVQRPNGNNRCIFRISEDSGVDTTIIVKTIPHVEKIVFPHYPFELASRDYQEEKFFPRKGLKKLPGNSLSAKQGGSGVLSM